MLYRLRLQTLCLTLGCVALPEWSAAQSVTYGQAVYGAVVYSQSVPSSPTITDVKIGDGLATVMFSPPTDTGGGVITGYTVTATSAGNSKVASCSSSPCNVTELTNGVTYSFTITADNAVGSSTASAYGGSQGELAIPALPYFGLLMLALLVLLSGSRRLRE
jgi:hypothetical protein